MTRKTAPPRNKSATPINVRSWRSVTKIRTVVSGALRHAKAASHCTQARAALDLGISDRQLRRILKGEQPITLDALMGARRIWPHFLRCLFVSERKARVI